MSKVSLIYVDLIEDQPMTLAEFRDATVDPDDAFDIHALEAAYREYVDRFQPWRLLIKSGDNHEPLFKSTESYFNEADAKHAAEIGFGQYSNVYLRQSEHGNVMLRLSSNPDDPEPDNVA